MDAFATATATRDAIARREVSAREVSAATLDRIAAIDPKLHAFQMVNREGALARAEALDRAGAPAGPLHGVPIAIKDNFCVRHLPATAGSRILEHYVPPYDATAIARLEAAGAVIVGKTVCDEFAMGSSTENSAYGPSRNPWDLTRTPGGSSGGSAAAVAAGLAPIALGSDTGGSVRQPASLCGIVGLKPTYGRVSRYGLIAFASSLDHVSPFGRSVADVATMLEVMAGHDPRDTTSAGAAVPAFSKALTGEMRGVRLGVPKHLLDGIDPDVRTAFDEALRACVDLGATVVDVTLPNSRHAIAVYYLVATAEASSNLARFDGVRYGYRTAQAESLGDMYDRTRGEAFGAEVKRRIMLGTYVLSAGYYDAYYRKAQQVRALIRQDFDAALEGSERVDVIALPTSPVPAFRLGERTSDPLQMYLADVYTVGANLAGVPAISVPCGFAPGPLPVGLQLVGRAWDESTVLRIADAYERATEWHKARPAI
jgi:aspartyl-tRNA(Asn)/glutamyl-tRNA(Gln) amidotransferase subunit A